jgi:hypothetical protein
MRATRVLTLIAVTAICEIYGCKMEPDIASQRDMGFNRAERSGEVMAERSGPPTEDTTTPASVHQREAADALASGKREANTRASTPPGPG